MRSSETTFDRSATTFDVLQWLFNAKLLDSTPYLCSCLKLYLNIGVSTASCVRSFSKLKLIKSYIFSSIMNNDRLSAPSILSIERDYVQKLEFEDIIAAFALRRPLIFYLYNTFVRYFLFLLFLASLTSRR